MRKPLGAALLALAIAGAGAVPAAAAPVNSAESFGMSADTDSVTSLVRDTVTSTTATLDQVLNPKVQAVNFAGTVSLSNCSGSVVRFSDSEDNDPALVMSNGHCLESGMPGPGEVVVDQASSRTFGLLNASGSRVANLRANKLVYGTMTDTDVSFYQLTTTYGQIKSSYGIDALTMAETHPVAGTAITVASGYWKRLYSCNIDGFAYSLKEGDWTFKDSVRYTSPCKPIGGTSGSPSSTTPPTRSSPSATPATRTASAARSTTRARSTRAATSPSARASVTPSRPTRSPPASASTTSST